MRTDAPKGVRWWFPTVPAERLAAFRVLVGLYSVIYFGVRLPHWFSFAHHHPAQFQPIGPLSWLSGPLDPSLYRGIVLVTFVASVGFLLGVWYRLVAPVFGILLLTVLTYANSWGGILHSDNLWLFHVLVLACAPAADALSLDARHASTPGHAHFRYGWALRLAGWVCVLSYFVAGLAKLKNGGLSFIDGDTLRNFVAMDNVRKIELGSAHSPIARFVLPYSGAFQVMAGASLALELGAPLVMLHARVAKVWALAMWGFHMGVLVLMAILFPYPVSFIAFAPFFRTERLAARIQSALRPRARARDPVSPA